MSQFTFYFAEEGPGCGSEDIKKECDIKCFHFFFSVFLMDVMSEKKKSQLQRTALKQKKKKHMHTGKEVEVHY